MPLELKIPPVGESITQVQIAEWQKKEGDMVQKDEPVAVMDSEKTTFELPAPASGALVKILHQAGETVEVGAVIAHIDPATAPAAPAQAAQPAAANPNEAAARRPPEPAAKAPPSPARETRLISEIAPGSAPAPEPARDGMGGQPALTVRQAESEPEPTVAAAEEEIVPTTMLRRTIARRLVEAKQTMAMLTTFNEVDMSAVQMLRHEHQETFQQRYQIKLGLMSFFVKAAIDGLKQFPQLNAELRGDDIVFRNYFDIGVAIASARGLVVPVLHRAERLSFAQVEQAIAHFAERARNEELKPEDLAGGTFTITNGGVFGSLLSTPIINPPQSGILGLHAIQERPVVHAGKVVIRPMMYVALTYDHRLVDGREAVLFLRRVKEAIESPARMLIEA